MNAIELYFETTGDTPAALARRIGRASSTITRLRKGQRNASFGLARDIERGTDGKLTAVQIIAVCFDRTTGSEAA